MEEGARGDPIARPSASGMTMIQAMRWRWLGRTLSITLFEPYVIVPLLQGKWLWNAWLRSMGADVSMGALVLGYAYEHDLVKVSGMCDIPRSCTLQSSVDILGEIPAAPLWLSQVFTSMVVEENILLAEPSGRMRDGEYTPSLGGTIVRLQQLPNCYVL